MDLKELIARQRAKVEQAKSDSVDVVLGGELAKIAVQAMRPDEWQKLIGEHPPRAGAGDSSVGYNQYELTRDYPAELLSVNGEDVTREEWADLFPLLDVAHQNNVHTVVWGVNVFGAIQELQKLGKAAAGQPSS